MNKKKGQSPAQRMQNNLVSLKIDLRVKALDLASEIKQRQNPHLGLTGTWSKEKESSDDMTAACDLVALPWILRRAILFLNKLEIADSPTHFMTNIKAGGIMDVKEIYDKSGEMKYHSRRDKRKGKHRGRVFITDRGDPCINCTWDDPYGGECWDTFILSEDANVLEQVTEMKMLTGRELKYKTVYRRVVQK